ncbi:MAG TPA: hypothetical protein VF260_11470 [Bacilli bacterium]
MEPFFAFLTERWYVVAAAVVILFLVIKLVKAVIKWVIVLVLIAGVLIYGTQYGGEIKDVGQKIVNATREEAVKALLGEAEQAKFTQHADGTFDIATPHARLTGAQNSDWLTVTVGGHSFKLKKDDVWRQFIEQARKK